MGATLTIDKAIDYIMERYDFSCGCGRIGRDLFINILLFAAEPGRGYECLTKLLDGVIEDENIEKLKGLVD